MAEVAAQRRPRDRKEQIVAAAARHFAQRGFHDAFVADIAAEVGITASALYRHFAGKAELLVAAIELELAQLEEAYAAGGPLDAVLDRAAGVLLRPRRTPSLWQRNEQLLAPEVRVVLAQRYDVATAALRDALRAARPDLGEADVVLLAAAAHDLLDSARAYERAKVEPARARGLMVAAASAVAALPAVLADAAPVLEEASPGMLPASRRQAALSAAVRLFAERGFEAVGMDDIGAAAGITGPTLYHHFPGKSAILVEVIMRCLDAMSFDLAAVLAGTDDPALALDGALASFVRINVAQRDALTPLFTEIGNVRPEERAPIRRAQQDYVHEWAVLLAAARDDLTTAEAQALVRSTQTVVSAMRRRLPLSAPAQRAVLHRAGRAVLGLPGDSPRD
ncbi:TetR/AcrR family transcriptional regulator [Nocardioides ginsengisoli]|uniref:TetR/AcrR family transcriptional regulator n=1 Tax=Nocardioides ginsengisoli TaxID=363868 RepID=A0ABW3W7N1_9ACTN